MSRSVRSVYVTQQYWNSTTGDNDQSSIFSPPRRFIGRVATLYRDRAMWRLDRPTPKAALVLSLSTVYGKLFVRNFVDSGNIVILWTPCLQE